MGQFLSLSHVSLFISQSLILSLLSVLTHSLSSDSKLHSHHTMARPTVTGHGKPPSTHYFSSLSRCRSVWWRGDWRLGFGAKIGVWVWCGDQRWVMGLPWVLFGFAMFGCGVEWVVQIVWVFFFGRLWVAGGGGVKCVVQQWWACGDSDFSKICGCWTERMREKE